MGIYYDHIFVTKHNFSFLSIALSFLTGLNNTRNIKPKLTETPVVIDVDPGIDYSYALFIDLMEHLKGKGNRLIEILGITCIKGNTTVENAIRNVATVLHLAGVKDVSLS